MIKCISCTKNIYNKEFLKTTKDGHRICQRCYRLIMDSIVVKHSITSFWDEKIATENFQWEELKMLLYPHSHCPKCNSDIYEEDKYCQNCGFKYETSKKVTVKYCSKCNTIFKDNQKYCRKDGAELNDREITITPTGYTTYINKIIKESSSNSNMFKYNISLLISDLVFFLGGVYLLVWESGILFMFGSDKSKVFMFSRDVFVLSGISLIVIGFIVHYFLKRIINSLEDTHR